MFGELDTYSLIDFFPFDAESYLSLFRLQNEAWWPLHVFIAIALFIGRRIGIVPAALW